MGSSPPVALAVALSLSLSLALAVGVACAPGAERSAPQGAVAGPVGGAGTGGDGGAPAGTAPGPTAPEAATAGGTGPPGTVPGRPATTTTRPPAPPWPAELAEVAFERLEGGPATLGEHAGRPLVVNVFAAWCVPCRVEMPDLQAAHQRWGDRVGFLGVGAGEPPEVVARLVAETGVAYPIVLDVHGDLRRTLRGTSIPTTAFITAAGEVVEVHPGLLSAEALESRIADLVARSG